MKILFFEVENSKDQKYIEKALGNQEIYFFPCPLTTCSIPSKHLDADVICISFLSTIDKTILDSFRQLKLIVTRSTGFDHIDIGCVKNHKIKICNIPSYASTTVAEHTFALILTLSRKIAESCNRIEQEHIFSCQNLAGIDLYKKTLGIIGMGNIGKNVAKIAHGFNMNVIAYDINCTTFEHAASVDISTLLTTADIISLHVPLTPETRHLINKTTIKQLKRSAYLINTARGSLIETEALLWALSHDALAGAACDVLENEHDMRQPLDLLLEKNPNPEQLKIFAINQVLMNHPRMIITPHNAFQSQESLKRLIDDTIDAIKGLAKN